MSLKVEVSREFLEVIANSSERTLTEINFVIQQARSLLSAPVVERQEPVAWFTDDHLTDKSATTWDSEIATHWLEKGWPVSKLFTYANPVDNADHLRARIEFLTKEIHALTDRVSPVPVAVVLPTLDDFADSVENIWGFMPEQLCLLNGEDLKRMWLGCIDKVKELNP